MVGVGVVVLLLIITNHCFIYVEQTQVSVSLCVLHKYKHRVKGSTYALCQRTNGEDQIPYPILLPSLPS